MRKKNVLATGDDDALLRRALSVLGKRSAAKLTAKELTERGKRGAKALWASLSPEERSVEMKRRAKVREHNRATKSNTSKPRRTHRILGGSVTKVLKAFKLKMKDMPDTVPYLVEGRSGGTGLALPDHLASVEIRQIGYCALMYDTNGFSLGDILLWVDTHPATAPITYNAFREMVYKSDVGERTVYNRKSVSNSYDLNERLPLSWAHHDAARVEGLPKHERLKILRLALKERWSVPKIAIRADARMLELTGGERKRPWIEMLEHFEEFYREAKRVVRLHAKPTTTKKEQADLERATPIVLKMLGDMLELIGQSPVPPLE